MYISILVSLQIEKHKNIEKSNLVSPQIECQNNA